MLLILQFLQLLSKVLSFFIVPTFIINVKFKGHAESKHEFVLFKETSADIGEQNHPEVIFKLLDSALVVLYFFCTEGKTLIEEVFEPLHGELIHGVQGW